MKKFLTKLKEFIRKRYYRCPACYGSKSEKVVSEHRFGYVCLDCLLVYRKPSSETSFLRRLIPLGSKDGISDYK